MNFKPDISHLIWAALHRLSLTPCFSGVFVAAADSKTVSTVSRSVRTVETVSKLVRTKNTPLKQGVNERRLIARQSIKCAALTPDE